MKWTTRSLWWRGPLLRGLDRLHRWYILRYCPLSKSGYGPNDMLTVSGGRKETP